MLGLTIAQELRLGHRRLDSDQLQTALDTVGLTGLRMSDAPEQLSGGQQRPGLSGATAARAELLLLDEPTAGLDWSVRADVLNLLSNLSKQGC